MLINPTLHIFSKHQKLMKQRGLTQINKGWGATFWILIVNYINNATTQYALFKVMKNNKATQFVNNWLVKNFGQDFITNKVYEKNMTLLIIT